MKCRRIPNLQPISIYLTRNQIFNFQFLFHSELKSIQNNFKLFLWNPIKFWHEKLRIIIITWNFLSIHFHLWELLPRFEGLDTWNRNCGNRADNCFCFFCPLCSDLRYYAYTVYFYLESWNYRNRCGILCVLPLA